MDFSDGWAGMANEVMDPTTHEERLSTAQVARVLELAARIDHDADDSGLTLSELEDVAREAGIPPEAIRNALAQIARGAVSPEAPDSRQRVGSVGGTLARTRSVIPSTHREGGVVDARLTDGQVDGLVKLLDQLEQIRGQVTYEPGVLRWVTRDGFHVELHRASDETEVIVELRDSRHMKDAFLGTVGLGTLTGLAIGLLAMENPAIPATFGAVAGAVGLFAYARARAAALRAKISKRASGFVEVVRMVASGGRP